MDAKISRYLEAFRSKKPFDEDLEGVYGRVTRGSCPEHFAKLSHTPFHRSSWVMGAEGLREICGLSGIDALYALGFEKNWILDKLRKGEQFRLLVFPASGVNVHWATWDGVFNVVKEAYPEIANSILQYSQPLREMGYSQLVELAGYDFLQVNLVGMADPRYMPPDRYIASERTLVQTRAFLFDSMGLSVLYTGDGYTIDPHTSKRIREYLTTNVQVSCLPGLQHIDFEVDLEE